MTSISLRGSLGSVASLLAATLYQGNPDRNHNPQNIISYHRQSLSIKSSLSFAINEQFIYCYPIYKEHMLIKETCFMLPGEPLYSSFSVYIYISFRSSRISRICKAHAFPILLFDHKQFSSLKVNSIVTLIYIMSQPGIKF